MSAGRAGGDRFLLALVFIVGMASLGTEIGAARLLAPYFGASTIIWANTIGVVLVALAVGYSVGGRVADRHPDRRVLCVVLLVAAGLLALVPFAARPFFSVAVDALDEVHAGAFAGSLVGVLAMVALPVALLGAASPWAVRLAVADVSEAGAVAGRMFAVSTAGSLVGTFLSALLLIPAIGTQRTFIAFASVLAIAGAAGLGRRFAVVPVAIAALAAIPVGTLKAEARGSVIYETETAEQYVRVVREPDGDRLLELNEGHGVHSMYRPGSFLTGRIWDGFLVAPLAALGRPPARVAILGNGAGTVARAYGHYFPATRIDAVEVDGELTRIGRRWFHLRNPRMRTHSGDARVWLRRSRERFDAVFVDAYRQPYIPFHLVTREFFELAARHLVPGGVLVVNIGHPIGDHDLERALGRTVGAVFPRPMAWRKEDGNTLLVASRQRVSRRRLLEGLARVPDALKPLAADLYNAIAPARAGGPVYTDDRAPIEWLTDRAILGYVNGR